MKKVKKYVTVHDGVDFRTIADVMTKNDFRMNHATARNVLITAIKKLLNYSAEQIGTKLSSEAISNLIKDQELHDALADVLFRAHHEKKETK